MNEQNYGYIFNELTIKEGKFIKSFKNDEGKQKINNEILFYSYIKKNNINFPIPKILDYEDGKIVMEYLNEHKTLTTINHKKINIEKILKTLQNIHEHIIYLDNTKIMIDIEIETSTKIFNRYKTFNWEENKLFNEIKSVNDLNINKLPFYINIITNKCIYYLKERNYYNLIHGDTHLGNIMENNNEYKFIDPRGFFGKTKLFGLKEYDYAKLLFGLSGYSIFDLMEISELNILNHNINIEFIKDYETIFDSNKFDNLTKLLSLSIWLGNNSCFIDENKKIISLSIALYYCEKILDNL